MIKAGDKLIAVAVRGINTLTMGKTYKALKNSERVFFNDYIAVLDDKGEYLYLHADRFEQPNDILTVIGGKP